MPVLNKQAWETFKFAALFSDIDLEAAFASRPSKWLAVAFSTLAALLTFTLISSIVSYESNNHHRVQIGRLVSSNLQKLLLNNITVQVSSKFLVVKNLNLTT